MRERQTGSPMSEREMLVAAYDPKLRNYMHCRKLVKDGEQHWIGGIANYYQGGSDVSEPDEGDSEEDGYDKLGEHFRNQNF